MSETIVITEQSTVVVSGLLGVKGDTGDITPQLEQLRDDVAQDKTLAQTSASTATAQAVTATQQANIAVTAAGTATTQANIATSQAVQAQTAATTSAAQATVSTTQASSAQTQATLAQASAQAAATEADAAQASATTANIKATLAVTKSEEAAANTLLAISKAQESLNSANLAAAQATVAISAAGTATTQANIAVQAAEDVVEQTTGLVLSAAASAETAVTKAAQAAASANAALVSEQSIAASAATAANQAAVATAQATSAGASAGAASTTKDTVNALLTTFRQVFLGSFASDAQAISFAAANNIPITDGIMYQDSVADKFRIYNGTAWQDYDSSAQASQSSAALSAANAGASASTASNASAAATAQAAIAVTNATNAAASATAAAGSAGNATASASTATAAATTSSTQAGIATSAATTATTAATTATTQAGIATSAATTATTQAGIATASAASATQVAAQVAALATNLDLTGVTAQALHRSPNAVTAMFVYDTSKDSDGGAWTEKCQHTSWYNEALNGKWLGASFSEISARAKSSGTTGANLVTNGTFDKDTSGWTSGAGSIISIDNGRLKITNGTTSYGNVNVTLSTVSGKTYLLTFDRITGTIDSSVRATSDNGSSWSIIPNNSKGDEYVFTATSSSTIIQFGLNNANIGAYAWIDNISVREVTALTTASGDYYQSTVDGKFYRLWKNLCSYSEFQGGLGFTASANAVASTMTGYAGAVAITQPTSGSVDVFKVHSFIPGVAHYFECVLEMTDGLGPPAFTGVQETSDFSVFFAGSVFLGGGTITALGGNLYKLAIPLVTPSSAGPHSNGIRKRSTNTSRPFKVTAIHFQIGTGSYELKGAEGSVSETFRGNKADFPRLAGIVAEDKSVTIYDLTEAGRPMWMRFVGSATAGGSWLNAFTGAPGVIALAANSGVLCVGGSNMGGLVINLASDDVRPIFSAARTIYNRAIVLRNAATQTLLSGGVGYQIVNSTFNAVAMTVLPDAPVDPVTGLQVPTIAVATAGGVSVIKHDGTVVSHTQNVLSDSYNLVITKDGCIAYHNGGGPLRVLPIAALPVANTWYFYSPSPVGESYYIPQYTQITGKPVNGNRTVNYDSPNLASLAPGNGTKITLAKNGYDLVVGGTYLKRAKNNTLGLMTASLLTPTGFMRGDIRRAYLADVDVGSVSGTELVTNGTFDTDVTGWSPSSGFPGATATVVAGEMQITQTAANGRYTQTISGFTVGKTYKLSGMIRKISGSVNAGLGISIITTGASVLQAPSVSSSTATYTEFVFVATQTSYTVVLGCVDGGSSNVYGFDNVSVREAVADRSYKGSPASITGTLTKTQVAAASQLVAYSGFSAANYLREPYSADLDFGTGEWSCGAWVNVPVTLPVGSFPAIGSELVTNGDFSASDLTGYSFNRATGAVTGGQLIVTRTSADSQYGVNAPCNIQAGRVYVVRFDFVQQTGGGAIEVYVGSGASQLVASNISAPSSFVGFFTAASSQTAIYIRRNGPGTVGETLTLDSISVREASPAFIFDRAHSSGPKVNLGVTGTGFLTATAFDGTTTRTVTTTAAYNTATWIKPEAVYTTDGTLAIRVNGVEVAATRSTPLLTLTNTSAVLTIGNSYAADAPFPGSIALLKLSATVPTAEQSQWMYEQEKQMFRAGAQVCLPDAGNVVGLAYDDATDKWLAVSATNESEWSGLVRTSVTASPAGSYSKIAATSGIQLQSRTTTNPGVDVTIPSYGLREELVNRSQAAARLARTLVSFDYVGGFTANTTSGSTAIASVAGITYPVSYVGARVSGSGIPADTFVAAVSGTTVYLTKAATATATAVQISFSDFILPSGYETKDVLLAGVSQREGATQAFVRLFDGFKETVRFNTSPLYTALVQIKAIGSIQ